MGKIIRLGCFLILSMVVLAISIKTLRNSCQPYLLFSKITEEHQLFYRNHFKQLKNDVQSIFDRNPDPKISDFFAKLDYRKVVKDEKKELNKFKGLNLIPVVSTLIWSLKYFSMLVLIMLISGMRYFLFVDQMNQVYNHFTLIKNVAGFQVESVGLLHLISAQTKSILSTKNTTDFKAQSLETFKTLFAKFKSKRFSMHQWRKIGNTASLSEYNDNLLTKNGCEFIPNSTFCQLNFVVEFLQMGLSQIFAKISFSIASSIYLFSENQSRNNLNAQFLDSVLFNESFQISFYLFP